MREPCYVLLLVLILPWRSYAAANDMSVNSSILQLTVGLNLTMSSFYSFPYGIPLSRDRLFTLAVPTLHDGGLFFPVLSSPSFDPRTSPASLSSTFGFSLGFYFVPIIPSTCPSFPCAARGCNIYMAVCAGSLGQNDSRSESRWVGLRGAMSGLTSLFPFKSVNGFAAPVWIANLDRPIQSADQVSLTVALVADTLELQLRDGYETVWRVRNVGAMEIQDSGRLLIYDSPSRTHLVWQSSSTDTLVEGQSLTVGKQLVSNDSSYVARMDDGGLIMYMNRTYFNRQPEPPPYWVFAAFRDDPESLHLNINQLISTAPCSHSPAHLDVIRQVRGPQNLGRRFIVLNPGSCSSRTTIIYFNDSSHASFSWTFLRLENDGRLYSYGVFHPSGHSACVTRTAIDSDSAIFIDSGHNSSFRPPFLQWQECNVPMACGPFGVCTPGAEAPCACAGPTFEPANSTDFSQGCKQRSPLPVLCPENTDFVELESTASVLLFTGWNFKSFNLQVESCKKLCSSDCSCHGFFYQVDTSSCFLITDEISLLSVDDKSVNLANCTSMTSQDLNRPTEMCARNYVTHLKVIASRRKTMIEAEMIFLIIITAVAVICLVHGVAGYLFTAWEKRKLYDSMLAKQEKELNDVLPFLPTRFLYQELYEATQGFSKLLGAGGCGSVYAGELPDGRRVAVKILDAMLQCAAQLNQFLAEVAAVGRTSHLNIVRLVGFCSQVSQHLLVYEYVERGSLDRWLFVNKSVTGVSEGSSAAAPLLDWKTRYTVAVGIARGLNYLHEECEQPILHFDIKPQNILLDNKFVAKLADFGLSRLMQRDVSSMVTGVRGTPGYIDPEWYSHGTVSKKSDIYSMGMVFLEIVSGRRNSDISILNNCADPTEKEEWYFPYWAAKKCEQGLVMELVDKRLHGCGFNVEQVHRLVSIAFWCIHEDPALRPNASRVVQWLEGSCPIVPPSFSMALNATRPYNSM